LKPGSRAVFTQPPLPFKCPGAPQKIVYLTADRLRRAGALEACDLQYFVHAPVVFGVPFFARELMKVVARYGIKAHFQRPRGGRWRGEDCNIRGRGRRRQGKAYDSYVRHAARFAAAKPARCDQEKPVGECGWLGRGQSELDAACPLPKRLFAGRRVLDAKFQDRRSRTKQSPIVVRNLLRMIAGYASCPLTTAYGKAILAEFIYGGKVTPTLPLDPAKERWIGWWIKVTGLPIFYWNYMLKGYEWFFKHDTAFKGDAA
jgi:sulfide:quinone oxidoreductase